VAPEREERRLAAILAADMVGYSRLMEADESGTIARQKAHRQELIDPEIAAHNGRIVKTTGDGLLVEFASVVDATECAVVIQRAMAEREKDVPEERRIQYRIGINLGDIVIDGDDILGDGVNVAARLEGLAEPGGICVPRKVIEEVRNKLDVGFEFLGDQSIKNIKKPIPVYRILLEPVAAGKVIGERRATPAQWQLGAVAAAAVIVVAVAGYYLTPSDRAVVPVSNDFCEQKTVLAVPDKPSVAVLPFDNLSGDPSQDYLADGLAEDIITTLAGVSDILVIARSSSFTYKGKPAKIQDVARDLGVRYVLEGSVQQADERLRVSAQLVDGGTGNHLWAERFDRDTKDIFAVKDEITLDLLTALKVELTEGEQARMWRRGTSNLEAYQLFWQSVEEFQRFNKEANAKARVLANRVTELDPNYSGGWLMLGWTYLQDVAYGSDPSQSIRFGAEFAKKAHELDDTNPNVYALLGMVSLHKGDPARAVELARKGLVLGPNQADVHGLLGLYLNAAGRSEEAIAPIKKAMRLSPYYPTFYLIQLGRAYRMTGRYEEAIVEYKKLACRMPDSLYSHLGQVLSYAHLGRLEEARAAVAKLLQAEPDYSLEVHKRTTAAKGTNLERDLELLRKAGLPE
jgi:adenylate cyclase